MKGDDIMKEMVKTCLGQKSNEIKVLLLENRRAMKQTEENLLEKIKQLKNQVEELKLREWELMGLVKLRQEKEEKIMYASRHTIIPGSSFSSQILYEDIFFDLLVYALLRRSPRDHIGRDHQQRWQPNRNS